MREPEKYNSHRLRRVARKKSFPRWGDPTNEGLFRPDINEIEEGDLIIAHLNGVTVIGKLFIDRRVIRSDLRISVHNGKRFSRSHEMITVSNIIAFSRNLTKVEIEELVPEFFI